MTTLDVGMARLRSAATRMSTGWVRFGRLLATSSELPTVDTTSDASAPHARNAITSLGKVKVNGRPAKRRTSMPLTSICNTLAALSTRASVA